MPRRSVDVEQVKKSNKEKRDVRVTEDAKAERDASAYGREVLERMVDPAKRQKPRDPRA